MQLELKVNVNRHGEDVLVKLPQKVAMALQRSKTGTVDSSALITALEKADNDGYMDSTALLALILGDGAKKR